MNAAGVYKVVTEFSRKGSPPKIQYTVLTLKNTWLFLVKDMAFSGG